jgi:toxin ParE1/3/4
MSRYTIAPEAKEDIKGIHRRVASDNPPAARRLRQTLSSTFQLLAQEPLLGELRGDLAEDLRMFCVGNYVILYYPTHGGVAVAQVVHGARDLASLWQEGRRRD